MNALSLLGLASKSEVDALKKEVNELKKNVDAEYGKAIGSGMHRNGVRFIRDLDAESASVQDVLRNAMDSMLKDDLELRKQ